MMMSYALESESPAGPPIAAGIEDLIGGTPLLEIPVPDGVGVRVLAKLESLNPLASVKDRTALWMLNDAEASGELQAGGTVIEATSGNTGISLAAICASRGYRCIVVMSDNATVERQALLAMLGAEVELTPRDLMFQGCIDRAQEIHDVTPGSWYARQHENMANIAAHQHTTGPEIWWDTRGAVDVFVCGIGTGGTMSGTAAFLKERNPQLLAVAVEPESSPVLSKGRAGPHAIQGLTGGFVADTTDCSLIDEIICVSDEQAIRSTHWVARRHGVLAGLSSGAAIHASLSLAAREPDSQRTIVCLLPDTGERYLSLLAATAATAR